MKHIEALLIGIVVLIIGVVATAVWLGSIAVICEYPLIFGPIVIMGLAYAIGLAAQEM